jgi:hypothetical protein
MIAPAPQGPSPDTRSAGTWILSIPASRTVRNSSSLFNRPSIPAFVFVSAIPAFELRALGFELRDLHFLCSVFEIGSHIYAWTGLDLDPPYLYFPHSWDDRHTPLCPAFID